VKLISVLVIWLHLRAGVSRSVANTILRAIQFLISTTLQLIEVALSSSGINIKLSKIEIPRDVRTAYKHHFSEPDIIRTACCPTCFTLYSQPIPWKCEWKESSRSRPCNTQLWKYQNTRKGPKLVPQRLYTTQSFDSWLHFFLSRQVIEDGLIECFHRRLNHPAAFGTDMHDVQDSPAWRDLTGIFSTPYHLVFGIYIDWFNPFTNKIAGKLLSFPQHST
jgi:hypothetical protein